MTNLARYRAHTGESLEELSRRTGVSPSMLHDIEHGRRRPLGTLDALLAATGLTVGQLFDREAWAPPDAPPDALAGDEAVA